jgi:hypothetical protein
MEMVFSNTGEKGKRRAIIVHQKKGKKWVQCIFLNLFLEVGIGGEHPKVDLAFISDRILSMGFLQIPTKWSQTFGVVRKVTTFLQKPIFLSIF